MSLVDCYSTYKTNLDVGLLELCARLAVFTCPSRPLLKILGAAVVGAVEAAELVPAPSNPNPVVAAEVVAAATGFANPPKGLVPETEK